MQDDKDHDTSPTTSDHVGLSPTMSDNVRPRRTTSETPRSHAHTLTSREVLKLFEHEGLPRSQRSIERYCAHHKLDCFFDSDEERYYITPESVETLTAQLKEIQARHESVPTIEPPVTMSDSARPTPTPEIDKEEIATLQEKLAKLESENFMLMVDNKAREQVMALIREQMQKQHTDFVTELVKHTKRVGELETEVKVLQGLPEPRQHATPAPTEIIRNAEFTSTQEDKREEPFTGVAQEADDAPQSHTTPSSHNTESFPQT